MRGSINEAGEHGGLAKSPLSATHGASALRQYARGASEKYYGRSGSEKPAQVR